jgi:uncharacterized protein (TIGR02001 family)
MKNMTTKLSLAAALTLVLSTFGAPAAYAEDAAASTVTFNAAVTSDYRYRGLSQTKIKPALQGGADYTHTASGLYAGVWASTIKWTGDLGADGDVEIDLYGGKRGELAAGLSYDVGGLYYAYPGYDLEPDANTFELYGQLGYGPAYIKYSHSTTNLFGTSDTKGSGYVDLGANIEITPGLVMNLHAGRQIIKNYDDLSYNDYKIGFTKDLGFVSLQVAVVNTDTKLFVSPSTGKNLGRTGGVVTLSKTF